MIRVTAEPERLTVQGHAGFAPRGQDIVCAAASALMLALCERLQDTRGRSSPSPSRCPSSCASALL